MKERRSATDIFRLLFDPRTPVLFIVGAVLLELAASAVYDLWVEWLGPSPLAYGSGLAVALLLLTLVVYAIYLVFKALWAPPDIVPVPKAARAEPRSALVLLLSPGEQKADEEALNFHKDTLRHLWLIFTEKVECDHKVSRIVEQIREDRGEDVEVHLVGLDDPRNAAEAYDRVMQTLKKAVTLGLDSGNLYVDITGGLRPAAIGATLACGEMKQDIEYVLCRYDSKGRVIPGTSSLMEVQLQETFEQLTVSNG
jgi:hypothetical protein